MIESAIYVAACAVTLLLASVLILSPLFDDGVGGKSALILLIAGAFAVLVNAVDGWTYHVQPSTLVTQVGVAALLVWRVVRLWRCGR